MSSKRYTEAFKVEAVKQVTERGHAVSEVAGRLGVSIHSLYLWQKQYGKSAATRGADADQAAELRSVKSELRRVTEERDILKNSPPGRLRLLSVEKHRRRVGLQQVSGRQLFGGFLTPSKNLVQG